MQPTPLVTINGTVLSHRLVTIDPRPATETSKAYEGGQYVELTLSTADCHLGGEQLAGLLAYQTVRFDTTDETLPELVPGTVLSLLANPFVDLYKVRGRWANSVGYRFSRLAAPLGGRALAHSS